MMRQYKQALLGTFQESVRSYYNVFVPHDSTNFSWRSVWRNKALLRVMFFGSTDTLGKILTMDNFRKRHFVVVEWGISELLFTPL